MSKAEFVAEVTTETLHSGKGSNIHTINLEVTSEGCWKDVVKLSKDTEAAMKALQCIGDNGGAMTLDCKEGAYHLEYYSTTGNQEKIKHQAGGVTLKKLTVKSGENTKRMILNFTEPISNESPNFYAKHIGKELNAVLFQSQEDMFPTDKNSEDEDVEIPEEEKEFVEN